MFLWDEKSHVRINKETVYAPIKNGGRQVLDLLARNEAIMVTWIRSYLDMTPDRATWAYVADALIAHHAPKTDINIEDNDKLNIFLQSWKTKKSELPDDIKDMLKVAKKNGVRIEGIAFSREIIQQMPLWYHGESTQI